MAARFGYASENGNYDDNNDNFDDQINAYQQQEKRRSTRFYQQQQYHQQQRRPTSTSSNQHHQVSFKPFTPESLVNIQRKKAQRQKKQSTAYLDPAKPKLEPDPYLASGQQLPPALVRQLPPDLIGKPIEDIDPYYADQDTFVIISRGKELTRFSATKALYILGPFHPIRRVVLYILVNAIFNLLVILTILTNCILMTIQGNDLVEKTEIIFTIIYTTEMGLKILARGFIMDNFTYLRDPWNWLDFTVIIMAYLTIVIEDLGNLSVMRTFRVLRALKTVAIIPGMKTIVGAVIDSVKNLKDVVVLTLFSLSVFSLLGLQIYMGQLTQKCIANGPSNMTDEEWFRWCNTSSHWIPEPDDEIYGAYRLCGNATGAQSCPADHTCIQGFGPNPDYGYTNFDTFGWALICSFRLMTQDFWEGLYMQVLKTAGSWHIIFFIVSIFLGSIYLMNLILAIVAMSYNELQRRAEEEEEAAAEDEAAFLESCRLMEMQDRLSQLSNNTSGARSSYRPSVEIGLVGQSLLASLCQNGLLGQHVRDKLNQQMILPGTSQPAARSHSLSVNLHHRPSCQPQVSTGLVTSVDYLDKPTMAASMTELRRKSSVRNISPTHHHHNFPSVHNNPNQPPPSPRRTPVPFHRNHQVQLQPHQGSSAYFKYPTDQSSSKQHLEYPPQLDARQANKLSPHHVSSSVLVSHPSENTDSSGTIHRLGLRSQRCSTASDRDLQVLKQRAAMIRIENKLSKDPAQVNLSLDSPTTTTQSEDLNEQPQVTQNQFNSRIAPAYGRRSLIGGMGSPAKRAISSNRNISARASMADCSASQDNRFLNVDLRSKARSGDRSSRASIDNVGNSPSHYKLTVLGQGYHSEATICQQPTSIHDQRQSTLSRAPSEPIDEDKQNTDHHSPLLGGPSTSGHRYGMTSGAATAASAMGGSTKTLHSNGNQSASTMRSGDSRRYLNLGLPGMDEEQGSRMHHLSVENFQQFSGGAPLAGRWQQTGSGSNSQLGLNDTPPEYASMQQQQQHNLQQHRQSRARLDSRSYIHPSTMVRSSFARPRQSVVSGIITGGPGGLFYQSGIGGSRQMSKDFSRRASDWSRMSMSTNVDLRRLLRLWSHTNPYNQNARPSIGSISNYSNQVGGYTTAPGNGGNAFDSRSGSQRPSSVGSAWQAYELISAMSRRSNRYGNSDFRYAMPLDDSMIDKMSVNFRDKALAYCLSCLDILCIWECCGTWLRIQKLISIIVFDPFTELFIILCILINTLFMALDSDDADPQMKSIFERGNYFFTATFAVEASMKIMALSPKFYFREGWNVFDSIIVGLSLLELGLEGVYGLSVLRSFRLLRVFKLAKSWPTLNLLISIIGKAVGDLGNLTFVLAIIVFIFAVMGMQLFGNKYVAQNFPSGELPRWNFTDFMHSFMIVFRILCAEWIEPMWDCLLVGGWPCIPFFLIAVTVGNLVVLNLFLALLLASFGASNLSSPQADNVDTKKLQEAIARFTRFGRWIKIQVGYLIRELTRALLGNKKAQNAREMSSINHRGSNEHGQVKSHIASMSRLERLKNIEMRTEQLKSRIRRSPEHHFHLKQLAKSQLKESAKRPSSTTTGYNYQYKSRPYPSSTSCSDLKKPTIMVEDGAPIPMIPIIVNEPIDTSNMDDCNEPERPQQQPPTVEVTADSDNYNFNCSSPDDETTIGDSLANSVALNYSMSPDEARSHSDCSTFDFAAMDSQQNRQQQQPSQGQRVQMYISGNQIMQPIREDSKDQESLSSTGTSGPGTGRNRKGSREASSACAWDMINKIKAKDSAGGSSCPVTPCKNAEDTGENERQQQREPLLQKEEIQQLPFAVNESPSVKRDYSMNRICIADDNVISQDGDQDEVTRMKSSLYLKAPKREEMEEDDEKTLQHIETYIEKCICIGIICLKWFLFRQYVRKIVEHRYFDQCILVLIVISSGTLALEDKHLNERPTLKRTLDVLDTIFTIIFSLEMILKWLAFGMRRYFGNIWSWLDFVIVLVSFVNLMASVFGSGKIQALKTMRTLRAMRGLRPLRALQRFQGMRVVVNALIQAIPSIFNVLLVCLIFWLIFSIMGVQMFGGKFWRCLDPETKEMVTRDVAANKWECIDRNLTWANPQINFDNVLNAYLALFQVATFKGWIDIMNRAIDSMFRDEQPMREANIYMYLYFVFFVIFGSFFTLNLFIGVIIDNFNEQKRKTGGSLEIFMTDDQKKYYHAMKKMKSKRPVKAMTRPKMKLQAYMFDLTTSKKFDMAIMFIIGLNMFVMALEHYGQSPEFSLVLENLNLVFIAIFTLECLCKIFAMRHFYFREPWNIFDFIVVDLSILGVVMKEYVAKYFVSPTLLRVVRVVKVGRVLRLVKGAKGIRTLLFALAMSLPALFNICLLLFLVMFIYAIFGMSFFMNVRPRAGIDETFNFETFTSSIIVLFEMSTSAGWDIVLDPLMDEENDCVKPDPALGIEGTCGNKEIAIFYLISYVIVTFLIIINMYIAVILENYSQATEDVQEGLTDDDYEMYYEIWQKFDPDGTQYLPYNKLSDFVDALEDPLRIPKPNDLALVVMDINIYQGDKCYCVDILDALTKYFFTRKGLVIQVNEHLQKVQSTLHETPFERITTTYMLKRQHYCAKVIQNCWRKWKDRIDEKNGSVSNKPATFSSSDT